MPEQQLHSASQNTTAVITPQTRTRRFHPNRHPADDLVLPKKIKKIFYPILEKK